MPSALGTSPLRPTRGPYWRDIRDFGAVPGPENPKANRLAIQAAIDNLKAGLVANPYAQGFTLYVPPGTWYIDRPINVDLSGLTIVGDGSAVSKVAVAPSDEGSCFWVGMTRMGGISADHYVDVYGKLDATVAPAPGQKYGIRTKGDSHVLQGSGPFQFGEGTYYDGDQTLTIDFCFDLTATGFQDQPLFGFGTGFKAYPWNLVALVSNYDNKPCFLLDLGLQNGKLYGQQLFTAKIPAPSTKGVHRVSIQVDLKAGTILAWVNRVQVDVVQGYNVPLPGGSMGMTNQKFVANNGQPFKIGAGPHVNGPTSISDSYTLNGVHDLSLYGLRASNVLRYANAGSGGAQKRLDGQALTDANQFLGEPGAFSYLSLDDDPSESAPQRWVTTRSGNSGRRSTAIFLRNDHDNPFWNVGNVTFRDLAIATGPSAYFGDAITFGTACYMRVERCWVGAGANAIGSWNWPTSYSMRFLDSQLGGNNASVYSFYNEIAMERCYLECLGRSLIWLNRGAVMRIKDLQTSSTSNTNRCDHVMRCDGGSVLTAEDVFVDIEFGSFPTISAFYAKTDPSFGNPDCGRLVLKTINLGTAGNGNPWFILDETFPTDRGYFQLEGLLGIEHLPENDHTCLIQATGQAWRGTAKTFEMDAIYPPVLNTSPGLRTGVVSWHGRFVGPPQETMWTQGSHVLDVPAPASGQFEQWRCVQTGTYGTANPPLWKGINAVDPGDNSLAAYISGHHYWTGGPNTQVGFYLKDRQGEALARLLTGSTVYTPPVLSLGLSARNASRLGFVKELSGNGYAQVPVLASAIQQVAVSGSPTGGTFTLTVNLGGAPRTTAPIAYNAAASDVQAALQALPNVGSGNVSVSGGAPTYTVSFQGALAYQPVPLMTTSVSALAGGSAPAVAVAQVQAGVAPVFGPSAGGTSSNVVAVTFPAATADWTGIRSAFLVDSWNRQINAVEIAPASAPLAVASGTALTFAPGTLVATRTANRYRGFADSVCDAINNLWLRGVMPPTPSLYVALSTNPADVTAAPAEPAGSGYARVAAPASAWNITTSGAAAARNTASNGAALAFPAPTGSWGTVRSVYLMDAATGGNVVAAADLTIPRSPAPGGPAPSFAPGALWVSRS